MTDSRGGALLPFSPIDTRTTLLGTVCYIRVAGPCCHSARNPTLGSPAACCSAWSTCGEVSCQSRVVMRRHGGFRRSRSYMNPLYGERTSSLDTVVWAPCVSHVRHSRVHLHEYQGIIMMMIIIMIVLLIMTSKPLKEHFQYLRRKS